MSANLVITFDSPRVLSRVPEQINLAEEVTVEEMVDYPNQKKVVVSINKPPFRLTLWEGASYDAIGDWTNQDVIDRINEICVTP